MKQKEILKQIYILEEKKKILASIEQELKDRNIRNYYKARLQRDTQTIKFYESLINNLFMDDSAVQKAVAEQKSMILKKIQNEKEILAIKKKISGDDEDLRVKINLFSQADKGWKAELNIFFDGEEMFNHSFVIKYSLLSGEKIPKKDESNKMIIEEFKKNVQKFNEQLCCKNPSVHFELIYRIEMDEEAEGTYNFIFLKINVVESITKKIVQTCILNKLIKKSVADFIATDKNNYSENSENILDLLELEKNNSINNKNFFVQNSELKLNILKTPVTQKLYYKVMEENPSCYSGENNPVENVSWYDAIYFCNKMSVLSGYAPVYSVNGSTDVFKWNYIPHKGLAIEGKILWDTNSNGFRLPTNDEWKNFSCCGESFRFSGSDVLDDVGWYYKNSEGKTHPVAQKKANSFGIFDLCGNVWEWVWNSYGDYRFVCGGSFCDFDNDCKLNTSNNIRASYQNDNIGFRIVCSAEE